MTQPVEFRRPTRRTPWLPEDARSLRRRTTGESLVPIPQPCLVAQSSRGFGPGDSPHPHGQAARLARCTGARQRRGGLPQAPATEPEDQVGANGSAAPRRLRHRSHSPWKEGPEGRGAGLPAFQGQCSSCAQPALGHRIEKKAPCSQGRGRPQDCGPGDLG